MGHKWICIEFLFLFLVCYCIAQNNFEKTFFTAAQRLMAHAGEFPDAIHESFSGKHDGIRKIVSSAFGSGLLSQLVENPIQAVGNMGLNLDQYGLNNTLLGNALKIPKSSPNLPGINSSNGDLLFNSGLLGKPFRSSTTFSPPETTPETVYVDGQPLLRPEILPSLLENRAPRGRMSNRFPDFPSFRSDQEELYMERSPGIRRGSMGQSSYRSNHDYEFEAAPLTTTTTTLPTTTTDPMANLMSIADRLGLFSTKDAATPTPQVVIVEKYITQSPSPPLHILNQPNFLNELALLEAIKRAQNQEAEIRRAPLPTTITIPNQAKIMDEQAIIEAMRKTQNQEVEIRRSPSLPTTLSPEILQMREKMQQLEAQIAEQKRLLAQHEIEEKELKLEKLLDVIKFGKGTRTSRISALQKQLRYAPIDYDELRRDISPIPTNVEPHCECIPIELGRFKGTWSQALASGQLLKKMRLSIGQLLEMHEEAHLGCTTLEIDHVKVEDDIKYAPIVWTFRTNPGSQNYRLQGNLISLDNNVLLFRIADFSDHIINVPICVLKAGQTDTSYNYLVVVDAQACHQATLFVKETFFGETYHELTRFLQHKITTNEMDLMESVEHAANCPDS